MMDSITTSSPARLYCTLVGAALVSAGVIGFFYSSGFGSGVAGVMRDTEEAFGLLAVNGWHNLLHIGLGLLALLAAGSAARAYALGAGLVYILLALWGLLDSDEVILDRIPLNSEDNVLYLILGLTGLAAGAATAKVVAERSKPSDRKPGSRQRPPPRRSQPG